MKKIISLCLVLTVLLSSSAVFAFGEDTEAVYEWDSLKIGAEGFVLGIVFHPLEENLAYIRTDVGGAYRWDAVKESWIQLCDSFSEPNLYGIDGIAIDPQDPNVVYIAAGKSTWAPCDVLKSTDRGATWTETGLKKAFNGNGGTRAQGENIAVDPGNSKIVYVGTENAGVWMSDDGAQSWRQVGGLDTKGKPARNVVFDKNTIEGGKTQTIYIGVRGQGIFRSTDAGTTWKLLDGTPANVKRMELGKSGALYVASEGKGLLKYDKGTWTDLTPGGYVDSTFNGISVDPNNENIMMALGPHSSKDNSYMNIPMWRTEDGGKTWENIFKKSTKYSSQPWRSNEGVKNGAGTANGHDIKMNPFNNKEVWTCDFAGPHRAKDVTATPKVLWEFMYYGIEEVVPRTGISPETGKYRFIAGIADVDGFAFDNILDFPSRQLRIDRDEPYNHPWLMSSADIDYCNEDANIVLRVGIDWNSHGKMEYSLDNTESWTVIDNTPYYVNSLGEKTTKIPFGRCAVSAQKHPETGKAVFIIIPCYNLNNTDKQLPEGRKTVPLVSKDYGETWEEVKGLPDGINITNDYWQKYYPIASDTVDGNVFYMLFGEKVYVSEDWGYTWEQTFAKGGDPNTGIIKAVPGSAGEVWFSMSGGTGIWRSTDYGRTFVQVPGPSDVKGFSFGKEAPGRDNKTLYVLGKVNGDSGAFRSVDMGATFLKINDDQHNLGNSTTGAMTADSRTFGIVYIGSDGRGYYLGMPEGVREELEKEFAGEEKERKGDPEIYYNNNRMLFIDKPSVKDELLFVPLREFMKSIGITDVKWDEQTSSVVITRKEIDVSLVSSMASGTVHERTMSFRLDSGRATYNGEEQDMAGAPFLLTDKMYVPLVDIVKGLGAHLNHNVLQKMYYVSDDALVTY